MKYTKYLILILLLMAVVWPTRAFAKDLTDDQVIFGSSYTLKSGDSLDGSLVVIGGTATVENAATLNGDLVLIGGTVSCDGTVNGSLVGIGGTVKLGDACLVNGDLVTMGASLDRAAGARVNGDIISGPTGPLNITTPQDWSDDGPGVVPPEVVIRPRNIFLDIVWFFFRTFMWAALAVLLVMFLYKPTDRVARAAVSQPVVAGGAGLITAFLAPFVLIALTITIILIPVTLIAVLVLVAAWFFGWIALGLEVGRRLGKLVDIELAPALAAGLGTFLLMLVFDGMASLVPCIGWLPQTLVGIWALGAVLITRFGSQDYPQDQLLDAPAVVVETSEPQVVTVITAAHEVSPADETVTEENDHNAQELPPDA